MNEYRSDEHIKETKDSAALLGAQMANRMLHAQLKEAETKSSELEALVREAYQDCWISDDWAERARKALGEK